MLADDLRPTAEALRTWGSRKPFMRRLWIYGSRAKGTAEAESDLDVAVEIDPVGNDEDICTSFVTEANGWRSELQPLLPYKLHLEWYDCTNKLVWDGVNSAGILVYERAT